MKYLRILSGAAAAAAALLLLCPAYTASADGDTLFPGDSKPEQEKITSGDYTYTVMVGAENSEEKAACIESYTGKDSNPVIPSELDGLKVVALGDYAFVNDQTLNTVTIPATVLGFGEFTFAHCTNLTGFKVEEGSEFCESRNGVLYTKDGTGLLRYPVGTSPDEITVDAGVISIGNVCFSGSRTLRRITFPDSLEYLGTSAFSDCTSLNMVKIPGGVKSISPYCFNSCTLLDTLELPDTVTEIGAAAFTNTALKEFTVPSACTTIGQQAFANTKLTSITLPETVSVIGYSAFGWKLNAYDELVMDDTFVIRGYKGSTAETYASDKENGNSFTFVDLTEQDNPGQNESSASDEPDGKGPGTGRIIGIVCCGCAMAAILAFAVLGGRKKTDTPQKESAGKKKEKAKPQSGEADADDDAQE